VFAGIVLLTRPFSGRFADRVGYVRVFLVSIVTMTVGQALLAWSGTREFQMASALFFGLGLGTAYPAYAAWVINKVGPERRGAAFGSILAGFDTGIGTGSMVMGMLVQRYGFRAAFGVSAALSALAVPYFLWCRGRVFSGDDDNSNDN
jgi:MFS family permease